MTVGVVVNQSVANTFYDERIKVWILFAKYIFYEYEYEYYSLKIFMNIFKYSNIFGYLKIIKPMVTATYQSEDCS